MKLTLWHIYQNQHPSNASSKIEKNKVDHFKVKLRLPLVYHVYQPIPKHFNALQPFQPIQSHTNQLS